MGAGVKTDLGCDVPMSEVSCGESISAWLEAWRAAGANAADAERESGGRGSSGGRRRRSSGPGWCEDKTWRVRVSEDVGRREAWRREVQGRQGRERVR